MQSHRYPFEIRLPKNVTLQAKDIPTFVESSHRFSEKGTKGVVGSRVATLFI
jgi:hypothetical protein